ncbi:MAG TPA: SIR2 family protein, partial [Planctomycetota bacterium]|nr:SIR2 family protein [Planctomycetota bacterium]
ARELMGEDRFRNAVEDRLDIRGKPVPRPYGHLWRIGIGGIVSLALDSFAVAAEPREQREATLRATGRDAAGLASIPVGAASGGAARPFVVKLVGRATEPASWAFERAARDALLGGEAAKKFLATLFAERTVLALGFDPGDAPLEQHFPPAVARELPKGPGHFLITAEAPHRLAGAENLGFQPIRYASPDGSHREVEEILRRVAAHLEAYKAQAWDRLLALIRNPTADTAYDPVVGNVPAGSSTVVRYDLVEGQKLGAGLEMSLLADVDK